MKSSLLRSLPLSCVLISLLVFLGIIGLRYGGYLESLELDVYDWSLRLRSPSTDPHPPITVVAISDRDIRELGHWPLTDEVLARTLGNLIQYRPRVVGVDIYRDMEVPPGREMLNQVLAAHPEIIMVMKFGTIEKGGIPGPPVLRGTDRIGFSDMVVDADGVVRRGLLFLDNGTDFFNSFSLRLALKYLEPEHIAPTPAPDNPAWVRLGGTVFRPFESHDGSYVRADDAGYQILLDLDRRPYAFPTLSLTDVLAGTFDAELIRDRMVLIGVIAEGVKDYFYTSQCGALTRCPAVSGIELHGLTAYQLLRAAKEGRPAITTVPDSLEIGWIAFWVALGGLVGIGVRGAWSFSLAVVLGTLGLAGVVVGAIVKGIWIPFVSPALGFVINGTVVTASIARREKKDRTLLMSLFARHVSPEVAQAVWQNREQILEKGRLRPQKSVVTTLFTDLEGFTAIAEKMEPGLLLDWLNTYMECMVNIIIRHGGVVDDYYGDMIKAGFGVLKIGQTDEDIGRDAKTAVQCAIAMGREMTRLNAEWQGQGGPAVRMRVGIHTGPVVVGSLGSEQRLKFTTLGDSVNIAARLESFQKDSPELWNSGEVCRILIGETTKRYLAGHHWDLKEVGVVNLKGKAIGVSVYKLGPGKGEPH